jgi:hypothetical protein
MAASGVAGVFITPSHFLPVAERELFVQFILGGDAGFAVLEVAAIAVCPSPLIEVHIPEAAKGRFGRLSRTHIKFSKQRNMVRKGRLQAKYPTCRRRLKWLIHPKWLVQTSTEILPKSVQSVPLTTSAR